MTAGTGLLSEQLGSLKGKKVKVFIASGKAYTGALKKFDDEVVVVGGENPGDGDATILLDQVSSFRMARDSE
jgi:soluble P-type ATPase